MTFGNNFPKDSDPLRFDLDGGSIGGLPAGGMSNSSPLNVPADNEVDPLNLPVDFLPDAAAMASPADSGEEPWSLDIDDLPDIPPPPEPLFERAPDGGIIIKHLPDLEELTPEIRRRIGDNPYAAVKLLAGAQDTAAQADYERLILGRMDTAAQLYLPMPDGQESIEYKAMGAGMSVAEAENWQKNDPKYLQDQITNREVLRVSGLGGYTTAQLQTPEGAERVRYDATLLAQMEADYLGVFGTPFQRMGYDLRVGFGQVGAFGTKAMAGVGQAIVDVSDWVNWRHRKYDTIENVRSFWPEAVKNTEARWLGPSINTGNPINDYLRTSIFQGSPFLAASVGLAMLPGVGASGAAGIIGGGMGMETYGSLRAEGVSPLLSAAAAGGTFLASYYLNTFQLERWTKALRGKSPMRIFSAGTGIEAAEEFLSESGESLSQGLAEATAKILGKPGYSRDDWWRDMADSANGAFQEGLAAGTLAFATRLIGLPGAAQSQARAYTFDRNFKNTGAKMAETRLYKEQPKAMAQELNNIAKHHGGAGIVFTSVLELEQGGLTKAQIVEGLDISPDHYDYSRDNNLDLAIPYGNAAVFAQQQKDAGNDHYQNTFRADPDAMTGREILEQGREMQVVLQQAEAHFKAMGEGDEAGQPIRVKIFRAGLRAAGYQAEQADAAASIFWARAERAAELWGIGAEEWLERKDVQLEMGRSLGNGREAARYRKLLEESRAGYDARLREGGVLPPAEAAPPPAIPRNAMADFRREGSSLPAAAEAERAQASQNAIADRIVPMEEGNAPAEAAQPAVLAQPAIGDADNQAWLDEAAATVMREMELEGEQFAPLADMVRGAMEQGIADPNVRAMAEQLGIALPESAGVTDRTLIEAITREEGARDPIRVREIQDKYNDAPSVATSSEDVDNLPKDKGINKSIVQWIEDKNILRDDYVNLDTGWGDIRYRRSSIRDVLNHSAGDAKLALLQVVPDLIRNGIYLETTKRNDQGYLGHVFAAKAEVDGLPYMVGFTINEDVNGRRYYNHEMTEMEKVPEQSQARNATSRPVETTREPITNILRAYLDVNQEGDWQNRTSRIAGAAGMNSESPSQGTIPPLDGNVKNSEMIIEELYQPAYHGSPHRFDRFSLDAIGTGEGAQVYGWGLYFAENREVSEVYRESLAKSEYFEGNRKLSGNEAWAATFLLDENNKKISANDAIAKAANVVKPAVYPEIIDLILNLADKNVSVQDGQLYKLDIPENGVLLDWDKPLSEQSEKVKAVLADYYRKTIKIKNRYSESTDVQVNGQYEGIKTREQIQKILDDPLSYDTLSGKTGKVFYHELSQKLGSDKAASLKLNELGIKGLRYFDGFSRRKGEGTHNFVIWDDNAINVLETYYQGKPGETRGSIAFPKYPGAPTVIRLFQNADVSTVIHELNHLFVADLGEMVRAGKGGDRARMDWAALIAFTDGELESADSEARRRGYEKIASAWERYAMEGRPPSPELADAFSTFRTYISRVYQGALEANAEPSAEVRSVFDRFLATDQQIADARELERLTGNWWDHINDMDPATKQRLYDNQAKAIGARRARYDARKGGGRALRGMGDMSATRRRVQNRMSEVPVYNALDRVKSGGGMNRTEVEALVGKPAAEAIAARHGEHVFGANEALNVDLEATAEASGYQGANAVNEMLANMVEAEAFERQANQRIKEEVSEETRADDVREEDFGDSIEDDGGDEETEALNEEVEEAIKEQAKRDSSFGAGRALQQWRLDYLAARRVTERLIGPKAMREAVDVRPYQKAERDARRAALAAARKGDMAEVTRQKKLELLHHLEVREVMRAREMAERVDTRYGTRALLSTLEAGEHKARIANDYAEAIKDLATYAGFTKARRLRPAADNEVLILPTPEAGSNMADFLPNLAGTVDNWLLNKIRPEGFVDWKDFTYDQIKEIDRLMRVLIGQGRGKLTAMRDLDARNLTELMEKSLAPMARRESRPKVDHDDRTWAGRTLNQINKYLISITIPENWFMAMDGNPTIRGEESGINQRMFWKLRDCQVQKDRMYKDLVARLEPHFSVMTQAKADLEARFGGRNFAIPGLAVPEVLKKGRNYALWDADMLMAIALNMGNDACLYRLTATPLEGEDNVYYGFSMEQLDTVARLFTADQWRAFQGIWDGLDSLYPELDAVTYRLTNRHVVKELAQAFTVETLDGQLMHMKGGYFPLVNDPMLHSRAGKLTEASNVEDYIQSGIMQNVHQSTRPAAGMTKERLRDEDGNPVVRLPQLLRTDIIVRHLDATTHFISHAETLQEFDRLTREDLWRETYVDKFGDAQYRALRNWTQNMARTNRLNNDPASRFMESMRGLATINGLGLRFPTGLKQRQGLFQAASFMADASRTKVSGWKYVKAGIRELGWNGNLGFKTEKMEWVDSQSDYMAARDGGHDREIRAMVERISPLRNELFTNPLSGEKVTKTELHNLMFAWIQANDRASAYAVWLGAYKQAMAGDANFDISKMTDEQRHKESVLYAEAAAATQASSFTADLTELQRDTGLLRFLSMFMSGNVRQGSRLLQYIDAYKLGDKSAGDVAYLAAREFVFPSLAWVFLAAIAKFAMGDDEDDIFTDAAWEVAETSMAPFPLVRDLSSAIRYGPARVPAVEGPTKAIGQVFGVPGKAADAKYAQAIGNMVSGVGFFTGTPVMNFVENFRPIGEAARIVERKKR